MRRSTALFVLCTAIPLFPRPAGAERAAHELIFDAAKREICQREASPGHLPDCDPAAGRVERCRPLPVCDPERYATFSSGDAIILRVAGARCTTAYRWQVDEREVAEATPGVRGLEEVEGMLAGILAPPEAKGVVVLEGVSLREQTVDDLVARLHTLEGIDELEQELNDEAKALAGTLKRLERAAEDYARLICPLAPVHGLGCPARVERIEQLRSEVENRGDVIAEIDADASCDAFFDQYAEVRELLTRVRGLRRKIEASPAIASYPNRLVGLADGLEGRLDDFAAKLRRVEAAAKISLAVVSSGLPAGRSESFLQHLRRLRETYASEDVSVGVLQDLATAYAHTTLGGGAGTRLDRRLEVLKKLSEQLGGDGGGELDGVGKLRSNLIRLEANVRQADQEFETAVVGLNDALEKTLRGLAVLDGKLERDHATYSIGPWTVNQVVTVSVFERPGFELPDLASLDQVRLPAGALDSVIEELPPADEGFAEVANGSFEVHKLYRFNVGIGIAASGLGDREFGVRSRTRLGPDGEPVLDDHGDPITDPVVAETGRDDEELEFPILITYYFQPFDAFPGEAVRRSHWGVSLGLGLDEPEENLFLGVSYQPTLGIQLVGGVHGGRRTTLQDGLSVEDVLSAGTTEAPTRREWEAAPFISVTFDALVFKRLLAGAG